LRKCGSATFLNPRGGRAPQGGVLGALSSSQGAASPGSSYAAAFTQLREASHGDQHLLKFDGIDGESVAKDHSGEIEALSWNWGLDAATATSGGGGAGVGKVKPRDIHFVHRYDKASPVLARMPASGRHIASAVLSARKA
jgi:type VI protein secretion system component Hcp